MSFMKSILDSSFFNHISEKFIALSCIKNTGYVVLPVLGKNNSLSQLRCQSIAYALYVLDGKCTLALSSVRKIF